MITIEILEVGAKVNFNLGDVLWRPKGRRQARPSRYVGSPSRRLYRSLTGLWIPYTGNRYVLPPAPTWLIHPQPLPLFNQRMSHQS